MNSQQQVFHPVPIQDGQIVGSVLEDVYNKAPGLEIPREAVNVKLNLNEIKVALLCEWRVYRRGGTVCGVNRTPSQTDEEKQVPNFYVLCLAVYFCLFNSGP